jgi:hypothetical protein
MTFLLIIALAILMAVVEHVLIFNIYPKFYDLSLANFYSVLMGIANAAIILSLE